MFKKINTFFDRLEDRVRGKLSRIPVVYALVGGVGIVLFWHGVTEIAISFPFMNGPVSLIISLVLLTSTGIFVSYFVGDQIIISGLKGEKKLVEKNREEIEEEQSMLMELNLDLNKVRKEIQEIKELLQSHQEQQ